MKRKGIMARVRIPSSEDAWKRKLLNAAKDGDTESLLRITKCNALIDETPWFYTTYTEVVYCAASHGHGKTVEAILTMDDMNCGLVGVKALGQAIKSGDEKIVKILLQNGTNVNYEIPSEHYSETDRIPLLVAIHKGSRELVQLLLNHGANSCATDGYTSALMNAVEGGHIGIVDDLLKAGANPDVVGPHIAGDDYCTALHLAAIYQIQIDEGDFDFRHEPDTNFALLKLLLVAGASVKFEELVKADPRFIRVTSDEELDEWQDREDEPGQWTYATLMEEGEFSGPLEAMFEYGCGFEEGHAESINLLYAAGASVFNIERGLPDDRFFEFIRDKQQEKQQPPLTLQDRCRRQIRDHLFSSSGANYGNLVYAVSKLPMPTQIKKYLLFDVPNIFEGPE